MSDFDLAHLKTWEGRSVEETDTATLAPARALFALLDRDPLEATPGARLPALFHWLYFLPICSIGNIGADGHPKKGGFLPPTPFPRRMFAGASLTFDGNIFFGEILHRRSTIKEVNFKAGKSGPLLFVQVEHAVTGEQGGSITELRNIVYREESRTPAAAPVLPPALEGAVTKTVTPDEVMLFQFSALTYNSHRIHYDQNYATSVEHYPERVVHGPLTALLLLQSALEASSGAPISSFEFRGSAPLFINKKILLECAWKEESAMLRALNHQGELAMTAHAQFKKNLAAPSSHSQMTQG